MMFSSQKGDKDYQKMVGMKYNIRLVRALSWTLIGVGSASLVLSIIFSSSILNASVILAFIGLSLVFWGAILIYIPPEEYTKKVLLDATISSSLENLNEIITELEYKGDPIYLPPKYFRDRETKLYITKKQNAEFLYPKPIVDQEKQLFLKNPEGILITPPGAQLKKIFEKRLDKSFAKSDLQYFRQNLPKLFIEDLEIADKLEITIKSSENYPETNGTRYGTIHLKLINIIFKDVYKKNQKLLHAFNTIGCPIFSAIASALTEITGKPLIIDNIQSYEDGNVIEVTYKIERLEYIETPEASVTNIVVHPLHLPKLIMTDMLKLVHSIPLPKLIGISLIISGVLALVWIAIMTWYDLSVWHKDLGFILFAYRTGEPIGLGIGMKFIHYFMIGSILLLVGTLTYLKKGKKIIEALTRPPLFPRLLNLSLIIIGTFILIWISDLVCYELIVWHKSFNFVLFTYGAGEPIGLGIGMKVIHYFIIGFALLFLSLIIYIKKRGKILSCISP